MPNMIVNIKQNLPANVVQIAHIGGDIADVTNAAISVYKDTNPILSKIPFQAEYDFDVILDDTQSSGELGIGINSMLDNNMLVTNVASHPRFGNPIPLFCKYEIQNHVIVMPVDSSRYDYLFNSASTSEEFEELSSMDLQIDNSLIDRIYFTDLYNEMVDIKFNIKKEYISINTFNITVYIQSLSNIIGSMFIIYNDIGTNYRKILNTIPIFERKSWNLGNIFYGADY